MMDEVKISHTGAQDDTIEWLKQNQETARRKLEKRWERRRRLAQSTTTTSSVGSSAATAPINEDRQNLDKNENRIRLRPVRYARFPGPGLGNARVGQGDNAPEQGGIAVSDAARTAGLAKSTLAAGQANLYRYFNTVLRLMGPVLEWARRHLPAIQDAIGIVMFCLTQPGMIIVRFLRLPGVSWALDRLFGLLLVATIVIIIASYALSRVVDVAPHILPGSILYIGHLAGVWIGSCWGKFGGMAGGAIASPTMTTGIPLAYDTGASQRNKDRDIAWLVTPFPNAPDLAEAATVLSTPASYYSKYGKLMSANSPLPSKVPAVTAGAAVAVVPHESVDGKGGGWVEFWDGLSFISEANAAYLKTVSSEMGPAYRKAYQLLDRMISQPLEEWDDPVRGWGLRRTLPSWHSELRSRAQRLSEIALALAGPFEKGNYELSEAIEKVNIRERVCVDEKQFQSLADMENMILSSRDAHGRAEQPVISDQAFHKTPGMHEGSLVVGGTDTGLEFLRRLGPNALADAAILVREWKATLDVACVLAVQDVVNASGLNKKLATEAVRVERVLQNAKKVLKRINQPEEMGLKKAIEFDEALRQWLEDVIDSSRKETPAEKKQ